MFGAGTPFTSHGNTTVVPYSPKVSGLTLATNVGASARIYKYKIKNYSKIY